MGRNRTIRTEVHSTIAIASLPDTAWRVFFGLYPLVDDEGRTPADAAFIAGQVFWATPRPIEDVRHALALLSSRSLVQLYAVADVPYLAIVGWADSTAATYQRIDKPQPAKFPGPSGADDSSNGSAIGSRNESTNGFGHHATLRNDRDRTIRSRIGVEGKGNDPTRHEAAMHLAEQAVNAINRLAGTRYRPDSKPTTDACTRLLRAGYTVEQVVDAIAHVGKPWVGHIDFHSKIRPATLLQFKRVRDAIEDIEAKRIAATSLLGDVPPSFTFDDGNPWDVQS